MVIKKKKKKNRKSIDTIIFDKRLMKIKCRRNFMKTTKSQTTHCFYLNLVIDLEVKH